MKDASDNKTLELIPAVKKRGRPATGNAMTAAERMRKMRRRIADIPYSQMSLTCIYEWLAYAVRNGYPASVDLIYEELRSRAVSVRDKRLSESAQVEPAQVEPAQVEPAQVEPAQVEPAQVEPAQVEPANLFLYVATLFDRENQSYFDVHTAAANHNQARLFAKRDYGSKTVKVFRVVKF